MTGFIFLPFAVVLFNISIAQVSNNNIQNRLDLKLNADPTISSTAQSNVEWSCINKALTNKCIVYHNDQWFNFSVPFASTYFINFTGQKCRDMRGLQLIIIEGNPCETKTYRILYCISQIRQDDVFVQLDSLKPKTQYLLNIDGFLGDFCEFGIQISEKPNGLPRIYQPLDTIKVQRTLKGRLVNLAWVVSEDKIDQFHSFKIYRAKPNAIKSDFIQEQTVSRNSYGAYILNYTASDSLQNEGTYIYRILGIQTQTQFPFLLATEVITYSEPPSKDPLQRSVKLNLAFKDKTLFKLLVYDEATHSLLKKQIAEFDLTRDRPYEVDLSEFIDQGSKEFMILVSDADAREALQFYYKVDGHGRLIQE